MTGGPSDAAIRAAFHSELVLKCTDAGARLTAHTRMRMQTHNLRNGRGDCRYSRGLPMQTGKPDSLHRRIAARQKHL
jgi:hypothetical protein